MKPQSHIKQLKHGMQKALKLEGKNQYGIQDQEITMNQYKVPVSLILQIQ